MKDSILFVSTQNVPIIEYTGIEVTHQDLLKWKDKLKDLGVDLMKVIVYANRDLFTAFMRSLLKKGIAQMEYSESIIPCNTDNKLPIELKLEFIGLKVFEEGVTEFDESKIVMKVFVYEVYNDYYLNSTKDN